MTSIAAEQKIIQYLNEAHATEQALIRTLQAHIAVTPRGTYRRGLDKHLDQTRDHATRLQRRLSELGSGRNGVQAATGAVQSAIGQVLALAKGPIDLVRGGSSEEKLLKNAKDECATEALEIATYDALEHLARQVGDAETAKLAVSIRRDEQRMLSKLRQEIPKLTEKMARAELEGDPSYDAAKTGAADAGRRTGRTTRKRASQAGKQVRTTASRAGEQARSAAREARRVPGVARVEGEVKGALAGEADLPIANYGSLTADEIQSRLTELSQIDLAKIDAFERRNENRGTILVRIESLRGAEPWPGYDELTVDEALQELATADPDRVSRVREYERRHKSRQGVLEATEREREREPAGTS
jgi:ferritin-like metal-binding protein YciE